MSYTVTNLITNAYYLSGIVSRDFQTVQGSQFADGLQILNEIIADKTVEDDMIPYYTQYLFHVNTGQQTYFIPNLIQLETLVFFIQTIRYEMTHLERRRYRGSSRADNIQSLPFTYNLERTTGGANISLYFFPDINYPMEAWGQFSLGQVYLNQDLTSSLTTLILGQVARTGTGTFALQQFTINGVDMSGTYANAQALAIQINNVQTAVTAQVLLNVMTLTSNTNIVITTSGTGDPANSISFTNFSTIDGTPKNQVYFPMVLDQFYISYLKYAEARRLCIEFDYAIPAGVQKQYDQYVGMISKRSQQLDLRMEKVSTLGTNTGINYGQVNLGHGWSI